MKELQLLDEISPIFLGITADSMLQKNLKLNSDILSDLINKVNDKIDEIEKEDDDNINLINLKVYAYGMYRSLDNIFNLILHEKAGNK